MSDVIEHSNNFTPPEKPKPEVKSFERFVNIKRGCEYQIKETIREFEEEFGISVTDISIVKMDSLINGNPKTVGVEINIKVKT